MAKGIDFPADISPSQRRYKPGVFPQGEFQGLNGAVTTVQYGRRPVDSELELVFRNIKDSKAYEIYENYLVVNGAGDGDLERNWVNLPVAQALGSMAGIYSKSLAKAMAESSNQRRYRYAEPPTITSVFPGVSTVTVKLRGFIDGAESS